uniref:Necrosis inducing protein (NPP1) n=1 Tax=Candidatus Kentrum sp. SD TaxID=2126332 RepID=A0A451BK48_9GAMM|nr:MAG: Necrosis inducing protein (NPP1) [Candidatus Kentron sp. SD]
MFLSGNMTDTQWEGYNNRRSRAGCSAISGSLFVFFSALLVNVTQASDFPKLDEAIPGAFVADLAPVFDFDGDGCLPSAGISRDGTPNPGVALQVGSSKTSGCYSSDFLETSNTMHRHACATGTNGSEYCGHFYSLYFEKDQTNIYPIAGHTHDWEYTAIWTRDGVITHGSTSAHGDLHTRPYDELPLENGHMKVVYHAEGGLTHAFRFADAGEVAENPYGEFVTPTIVSWYEMEGDGAGMKNGPARSKLEGFDYGSGVLPITTNNGFFASLNENKPSGYPTFDDGSDCYLTGWFSEEGTAKKTCQSGHVVSRVECSGSRCDNKRLKCCHIPGLALSGSRTNSLFISEEQPDWWYAHNGKAVVGMKCRGDYCDDISLVLESVSGPGASVNGWWTSSFSEEEREGGCDPRPGIDEYIAGAACTGSYCDNLMLYCKHKQ